MKRTVSFPSVTLSMKAQDRLREAGIESRTVRLRPGESPHGCGYGLELDGLWIGRADELLTSAGIPHGIIGGGT